MKMLADRLNQGITRLRSSGAKPTRISMGVDDAARLAGEDDAFSIYRLDGSVEGFDGVPILVIPSFSSVSISAEVAGQRGRTSIVV